MKKVFFLLIIFYIIFSQPCLADVSGIPEGAYAGKAIIDDSPGHIIKWPLLIVVANGHITGIFAPEDEPVLGSYFDEINLRGDNITFEISGSKLLLTAISPPPIKGKAQLLKGSTNCTSSYTGYYAKRDDLGGFVTSFANIGPDGTAVIVLGQPFSKLFFGKVEGGKFRSVFGYDLKGTTLNFMEGEIEAKGENFSPDAPPFILKRESTGSCDTSTSSEVLEIIDNFIQAKDELDEVKNSASRKLIRKLQQLIKKVEELQSVIPSRCKGSLNSLAVKANKYLTMLEAKRCTPDLVSKKEPCIPSDIADVILDSSQALQNAIDKFFSDDNNDGIPWFCEILITR